MTTLNDIIALQEQHEQQGGVRIGVMALWTVRDNLFVERSTLEAIASTCNLDKKYLPSPISSSTACTRAITATRTKLQPGMLLRSTPSAEATVICYRRKRFSLCGLTFCLSLSTTRESLQLWFGRKIE